MAQVAPESGMSSICQAGAETVHASMLLDDLRSLETELHKEETRRNRTRMEALLHPEFVEFGRSGRRYSRAEILTEYAGNGTLPAVRAEHFELAMLDENAALLTYASNHVDEAGNPYRHTLRSSIWVRTEAGWQMRFHQGTPARAS